MTGKLSDRPMIRAASIPHLGQTTPTAVLVRRAIIRSYRLRRPNGPVGFVRWTPGAFVTAAASEDVFIFLLLRRAALSPFEAARRTESAEKPSIPVLQRKPCKEQAWEDA
jgi:hypothetical protein